MMFRVGQEVACIDGGNWREWPTRERTAGPETNDVLVITSIKSPIMIGAVLQFVGWGDQWFHHSSFRPVVRTDISIFTAMLDKAPTREVIDA